MKAKACSRLVATICLISVAITADESVNDIDVPKLKGNVEIDGRLDEEPWSKAAVFQIDEEVAGGKATGKRFGPGYQTNLKIWRDDDALYLGFRCENPDVPMFLNAYSRLRDEAVFSDECIEIFVRVDGACPTRQFVFNAFGDLYDGTWDGGVSKDWNGDWQVATSVVRGAWYAEVRIPFSTLGNNDSILINCARSSYGGNGERRSSTWKAPGWFAPKMRIKLRE